MSKKIKGINIEIGAETIKLSDGLKEVKGNITSLNSESKALNKTLRFDGNNIVLLGQNAEVLKKRIEETAKELKVLRDNQEMVKKGFDAENNKLSDEQIRAYNREVEITAGLHKNLQKQLENTETKLTGLNSKVTAAADTLIFAGTKVKDFGDNVQDLGKQTSKAFAPMTAVSGIALKMAADFEDSMAKISTLSDETQVPIAGLKQGIIDLSKESGRSVSELSEAMYEALSSGIETADVVNYLKDTVNLSKAGFTDMATSVDVTTTILNAYGKEAFDIARISDILVQTQDDGKITVGELGSQMGRVIPVAASLGVNIDQLGASYALMTAQGINAQMTTTDLNSLLNELGKTGSDSDKALRNVAGKSFKELIKEGKSLGDILEILDIHAKNTGLTLSDMFGGSTAGTAALALLKEGADGFNEAVDKMNSSTGVTLANVEKLKTPAEALRVAFNALKVEIMESGLVLTPVLETLANMISDLVSRFSSLSVGTKETIAKFVVLLAILVPIITIIGTLISSFGSIMIVVGRGVIKFQSFITVVKTIVPIVLKFIAGLSGIAVIVPVILALLGGLAYSFLKASDETKAFSKENKEAVKASEELRASVEKSAESFNETSKSIEIESEALKRLTADIFALSEESDLSAGKQGLLAEKIAMLNEQVPGLNLAYNEQTNALNMSKEATDGLIESQTEQLKIQAELALEQETLRSLIGLETELEIIKQQQIETQNRLSEAESWGDKRKLKDDLKDLVEEENNLNISLEKEEERHSAITEIIKTSAEASKEASNEKVVAEEGVQEALVQTEEELKAQEERYKILADVATNAFDKINLDVAKTASEMTDNLKHNTEVVDKWSKDIVSLSDKGINKGLLKILEDAGPKSASTVANLVNASGEQIQELNTAFEKGGETATDALLRTLGLPEVTDSGSDMVDDIADGVDGNKKLDNSSENLIKNAKKTTDTQVKSSNFPLVGKNISEGIAKGVRAGSSNVSSAIKSVIQSALRAAENEAIIKSPSKLFERAVGVFISRGIAVGIDKEAGVVYKSVTNVIDSTVKTAISGISKIGKSNVFANYKKLFIEAQDKINIKINLVNSSLEEELKNLENIKALSEVSTREELAHLESLRLTYAKTAEEKLDLDKKIYSLKKDIQKQELEDFEKAGEALTEALKRQYEAEHDMQIDKLDEKLELIKDAEYDGIEIVRDGSSEKIDIYSQEYMAKIKNIDESTGIYLENVNKEIEAELEKLGLFDEERALKIKALRDEKTAIDELIEYERLEEEKLANERKIRELEDKISKAETFEEQMKTYEELDDFLAKLEKQKIADERKGRKEAIDDEISDIKEKEKQELDTFKNTLDEKKKLQENALKSLDEGILIDKSKLDEELKYLKEQAPKIAAEMILAGEEGQKQAIAIMQEFYPDWEEEGYKFIDYINQGREKATPELEDGMFNTGELAGKNLADGLKAKLGMFQSVVDEYLASLDEVSGGRTSSSDRYQAPSPHSSDIMPRPFVAKVLGADVFDRYDIGYQSQLGTIEQVAVKLALKKLVKKNPKSLL